MDKKYASPTTAEQALMEDLRRLRLMRTVEFQRIYEGLLEGMDLTPFEEWAAETVRNFAKEVALRVLEDDEGFAAGRREVAEFYAKKKGFLLVP